MPRLVIGDKRQAVFVKFKGDKDSFWEFEGLCPSK
jgi:hypothetical protein